MINLSLLDILFIFCEEHRNLRDITAEVMSCDDNGLLSVWEESLENKSKPSTVKEESRRWLPVVARSTPYRHAADLIIY